MGDAEWYDNKALYEMMLELGKKLETNTLELAETRMAMKQYNSLREKIEICEQKLAENTGNLMGRKEMWGYWIGAAGLAFAILSRLM